MTTVTENDLKELKDLITASIDENKKQFTTIENRLSAIEIGQAEMKGKLTIIESSMLKTADLAEKLGELTNWKQAGLIILTAFTSSILSGIIGGVIGWLIRAPGFNP